MNTTTTPRPLTETANLLTDLIERSTSIYLDLLTSLSSSELMTTVAEMQRQMQTQMRQMQQMMGGLMPGTMPRLQMGAGCGCHIPTPCWTPQPLGEVVSHVCPGATATIRLRITNCGATRREIKVEATGKTPGVKIEPPGLSLGPMEAEAVVVSLSLPANESPGQVHEVLLWVRGCKTHFLRWTVRVATRGSSCSCHEVDVQDCPDLIHHWYDHFYCERPCPSQFSGRIGE